MNWARSPTTYSFISKKRLERTRLRGWSILVSSPLVSVVSGTPCCWCDTDGPWFSLSNTSTSSNNKITFGETQKLRSHTEQFWSTNWSLTDPGADFFPPTPQSAKETLTDVLWSQWGKTKDLRSTDLKQEKWVTNMEQTRSDTEEYSFETKYTLIERLLQ